jgi:hypothetical protein
MKKQKVVPTRIYTTGVSFMMQIEPAKAKKSAANY